MQKQKEPLPRVLSKILFRLEEAKPGLSGFLLNAEKRSKPSGKVKTTNVGDFFVQQIKILALLLSLAVHVFGHTAPRAATPIPAPAASAASAQEKAPAAKEPSQNVEVLQAQLEQMKSFQDSMLTTIWGSLGVVVVIAFALVSFSWWNNGRSYERDKAAIRDEVTNSLRSMLVEYQEKVNERLLEAERNTSSRFTEVNDDLRTRVDEGIEKHSTANATAMSDLSSQIAKLKKSTEAALVPIRYDILEITHRLYQERKSLGAGLIVLTQLLELALTRSDFWVERVLNELSTDLKTDAASPSKQITNRNSYVAEMQALLAKVPDSLQPMAREITTQLKALPY